MLGAERTPSLSPYGVNLKDLLEDINGVIAYTQRALQQRGKHSHALIIIIIMMITKPLSSSWWARDVQDKSCLSIAFCKCIAALVVKVASAWAAEWVELYHDVIRVAKADLDRKIDLAMLSQKKTSWWLVCDVKGRLEQRKLQVGVHLVFRAKPIFVLWLSLRTCSRHLQQYLELQGGRGQND